MSIETHLAQLERKHQALDQAIATELAHPNQDPVKITALKRKKLLLKDEIAKIRSTGSPSQGLH